MSNREAARLEPSLEEVEARLRAFEENRLGYLDTLERLKVKLSAGVALTDEENREVRAIKKAAVDYGLTQFTYVLMAVPGDKSSAPRPVVPGQKRYGILFDFLNEPAKAPFGMESFSRRGSPDYVTMDVMEFFATQGRGYPHGRRR